jgi:phosphohistidine phosphatase
MTHSNSFFQTMARYELLILRHAKSDWNDETLTDFERPLSKRGKKDAPRIGSWLYREGLLPNLIISSPAQRARATTLKVCKGLEYKKKQILWEPTLYEASLNDLLDVLSRCPETAPIVLLVGHNPGLECLLRHLTANEIDEPIDGNLLPTATLARLELTTDWKNLKYGCATLLSIIRPKQLAG